MSFEVLLSPPDTGALERDYVQRAMEGGWVAPAGPDLEAFEDEMAARLGVRRGVALSSGTAALHLALVSWGVGPGDTVPVSTLTFAASVNAIRYVGAEPWFVDSEIESGNIDPVLLDETIAKLRAAGRNVPCVIPVDLLGKCADHTEIAAVAERHGVRVLVDAAESLGASHAGRSAGSFGDASVLSFNGNKILTTSGGGMLLTDDDALADHVRKLSTQAREPVPHYEHVEVGYNYRLSNILAALGRAQLSRLDAMMARRRTFREGYREVFAGVPGVRLLGGEDDSADNAWLTAVLVDPELAGWDAAALGAALTEARIESRPVWKPMHLQPVYAEFGASLTGPADRIFATGLTLPSGSGMTDETFAGVIAAVDAAVPRG